VLSSGRCWPQAIGKRFHRDDFARVYLRAAAREELKPASGGLGYDFVHRIMLSQRVLNFQPLLGVEQGYRL